MVRERGFIIHDQVFDWQTQPAEFSGDRIVMAGLLKELRQRYGKALLPEMPRRMSKLVAILARQDANHP